MADRPAKRMRRGGSDMEEQSRAGQKRDDYGQSAATASSTRPRRGTTNQPPRPAVIERSSPEDTRQSIHLTVKASPNKLRKATSGSAVKTAVNSRNIVSGKRASRSSRVITEVDSDEEEDEPEAMDVDDEDDEEGEEDDEEEDVDAEGEEEDDADDITPAPRIVVSSNESIRVKPPVARDAVEEKELAMADDDDDEELSELESELPDEDAEGEDEDAEGEEDDEMPAQNDDEEEDEDMDSDNGTPRSMSRSHTPDLSKMTRRQRAQFEEEENQGLMALSNEAQKKKHLTAEEHAMRRAEMARRRKNLSDKRNEEEKMDTINRLLKKQPPKRGRKKDLETTESGQEDEPEVEKASALYVRYTQNVSGTRMAVPEEWLQAPAGSIFAGPLAKPLNRPFSGKMVEEVA